ncbi:MAG: aminotransferase class I/II-fold pyridoxal phosphate-dependent enzyme [Chloroflexi bacterium]|nr:aminotransferase class I/II-fold pyridoxal phosphate-dependent enzyme [Chloroflexota bacterium]
MGIPKTQVGEIAERGERTVPDPLATRAVHAGEEKHKPYGALTTPVVQTSTFTFADGAEIAQFMRRKAEGESTNRYEYGRYGNPTEQAAECKMAALEGGEQALLFASGMAAISTTLLALLSSGDHLVVTSDCYHRSREFARSFLTRWGIAVTLAPIDQPQALAAACTPRTRAIFAETPTNPYLRVVDLERVAAIAATRGIATIVDSTFATPVNLRPLEHGIDLVIHSASKYLGGHNDLLAGVVVGARQALTPIAHARGVLGGTSSPHDAYLLLRGLKTLTVRVARQNENGWRVAQYLEGHPAVRRVWYPGLASHPDHAVAQRQMCGFGGVVSFEIAGGFDETSRFIDRLQLPYIGPTLGGVESIVQQPAALFSLRVEDRQAAGLKDNLVRYALGIEDADDLIADLQQALCGVCA